MKERIYRILVNRVPGIRDRYLKKRYGKKCLGHLRALLYLAWLNLQYYVLFRRDLAESSLYPFYEEKALYHAGSESSLYRRKSPKQFAAELAAFDVISFDVFDTLLLRPFSSPADLFYFVGARLSYPDFKRIRMELEGQARQKKFADSGTYEVTLEEIWDLIEQETGLPKKRGMQMEWEYEQKCCQANPYMLRVVRELQKRGKTITAASDMYLGKYHIKKLLEGCGYGTFDAYFVSCDWRRSKGEGSLYKVIKKKMGLNRTYAHIGDHEYADFRQANLHGFKAFLYPNVNHTGNPYRPEDMSAITGSLYRGIVNMHIHSGLRVYSREYEYGFVYGGLFVTGYCRFIHNYAQTHGIEKLLFLSRDGAVLLRAYHMMYPEEAPRTQYVYWSRLAALKLSARYYKNDYLRRFLYHKTDQGYTLDRIFREMELSSLLPGLCRKLYTGPGTKLTYKNVENVKKYLIESWSQVLEQYDDQIKAGKMYYEPVLKGCRSAAAIDIGWAGSGAVMLDYVVNSIWNLNCPVTGILAGTNTPAIPEMDASEPFLLSGKLVSYLYSQQKNRDLWKFHDPSRGHNLYWELLLGMSEGSLKGFYLDRDGNCECRFKEPDSNVRYVREIHRGILDFTQCFLDAERNIGYTIPISGRDAYAPMVSIGSRKNKKFMEDLEGLLDDIHVG